MKPIITETIKYIGVDDDNLDLFESQYIVPNGISYNSYLIIDEKIAVMDTVDRRKSEDWWNNLEEALEGRTPDYLVVHHMEPDHAGNIADFISKYPDVKIVASAKAIQMLPLFFEHMDFEGKTIAVKEGETLNLGKHTLQFFMARYMRAHRQNSSQYPDCRFSQPSNSLPSTLLCVIRPFLPALLNSVRLHQAL